MEKPERGQADVRKHNDDEAHESPLTVKKEHTTLLRDSSLVLLQGMEMFSNETLRDGGSILDGDAQSIFIMKEIDEALDLEYPGF